MNVSVKSFIKQHPLVSIILIVVIVLAVLYAGLRLAAPTLWPYPRIDHSDVMEPAFHAGLEAYYNKDYKAAMDIWLPMAEAGHPAAQFRVGRLFDRGEGVEFDSATAFIWYEKSTNNEQINAQYNISILYENGLGTIKDIDLSLYWLEKAAENKHVYAQFFLGLHYRKLDKEKSNYWFRKAVDQGSKIALVYLGTNGDAQAKAERTVLDIACVYTIVILLKRPRHRC